jgi:hypothetical protein
LQRRIPITTCISIENPNSTATTATITCQTLDGLVPGGTIPLPANSQTTVNPEQVISNQDFSTFVVSGEGKSIAVDRTMSWTGTGAPSPEGASAWGFECWLTVQNPGDIDANCAVTYMIENEGPQTVSHPAPANSRGTFNMRDDIDEMNASIKVEADVPVIAERAMYRNTRREGHNSRGAGTDTIGAFFN